MPVLGDEDGGLGSTPGEESPAWAAGMRVQRAVLAGCDCAVAAWYPAAPTSPCVDVDYGGATALFRLRGVARDADLAPLPRPRPLLLLAGAGDSDALDLGWLGAHLARRGNVCVAAGGAAEAVEACVRLRGLASWAADSEWLAGYFDATRRVIAGFDLGGIAALMLAGARPRDDRGAALSRDPGLAGLALLNPCPAGLLGRIRRGVIDLPVHVVVSAADRVAPPAEHGARLAGMIRGARLTRLAAPAGHHVFRGEPTDAGRRLRADLTGEAAVVHRGSLHECTARLVDDLVTRSISAR